MAVTQATHVGLGDDHALQILRDIVASFAPSSAPPWERLAAEPPAVAPDSLTAAVPADLRVPYDPRELTARLVDGSRFHEFKAGYGTTLVCGLAHLDGHRVGGHRQPRLWDDGVILPQDTRATLAHAPAVCALAPLGPRKFALFRMEFCPFAQLRLMVAIHRDRMSLRRLLCAALVGAATLVSAPAAGAAVVGSSTSSNWSGYVVSRGGTKYKRVTASWTVPSVDCSTSGESYSANWIGLGGASTSSAALEQLGTESDCSASGTARYDAWFEVVPAASSTSKMTVEAGDAMRASVTVTGKKVRLRIVDATRGTSTTKLVRAGSVDLSSAEWIVEAPSLCSGSQCYQTTVADFGTTGFTAAKATTGAGHTGTISDSAWNATAITLSGGSGRELGPGREDAADAASDATPSSLSTDGSGFSVTYGGSDDVGGGQQQFGLLHHPAERR